MNAFRKTSLALIITSSGLVSGVVLAQADQANEAAANAAANAEARIESDSRAVRDGDTITTNRTVVEKSEGARAQVTTPDVGKSGVQTPNRGAAAEARRSETAALSPGEPRRARNQ